jgi:hypothetical protein
MKALVITGLLGGIPVGGSMAFGPAGAAPAPGYRIGAAFDGISALDGPLSGNPFATYGSGTAQRTTTGEGATARPSVASGTGMGGLLPNGLNGVSCTNSTNCVAVGSYGNNLNLDQTLVEQWDSTAWSVVPSPDPGYKDALDAVSCTSSTNCVAVGRFASGSSMDQTLVES